MRSKKIDMGHASIEFQAVEDDGGEMLFEITEDTKLDGVNQEIVHLNAVAAVEAIWQAAIFLRDHHPETYKEFVADIGRKAFDLGVRVDPGFRLTIPCSVCNVEAEFDAAWAIENGYATRSNPFVCDICTPARPWPAKKEGA